MDEGIGGCVTTAVGGFFLIGIVYGIISFIYNNPFVLVGVVIIAAVAVGGVFIYHYNSYDARRDRSKKAGILTEQLRFYYSENEPKQIIKCLGSLPPWQAGELIKQATNELFELDASIKAAQTAEVSQTMLKSFKQNALQAAEGLWRIAGKLEAVGKQNVEYKDIEPRLQTYETKLTRLITAIQQARMGLAVLTLADSGDDALLNAETGLHALGKVAAEL
jgi:hypothetical protein